MLTQRLAGLHYNRIALWRSRPALGFRLVDGGNALALTGYHTTGSINAPVYRGGGAPASLFVGPDARRLFRFHTRRWPRFR